MSDDLMILLGGIAIGMIFRPVIDVLSEFIWSKFKK